MVRTNVKEKMEKQYTHQGAIARQMTKEQMLRRSVMSTMLWEKEFYEDGKEITKRIAELIPEVAPEKVAAIAVEAREKMKLRHMPLFIIREMAKHEKHKKYVAYTLSKVIQRADEFAEFLALYWEGSKKRKNGKNAPLSAQVKLGLAGAFEKKRADGKFYFDEYQLSKYNRDNKVKLRDALFLCHAKPINKTQEKLWKRLINDELKPAKTWEERLSAGEDPKKVWESMLTDNTLGALALIRNLRNMDKAGVSRTKVKEALSKVNVQRVLPFRFITAASNAPEMESALESAMMKCMEGKDKLKGHTVLVVDVSGSMYGGKISKYSEMDRAKVACSLAVLARGMCESVSVYATAGNDGSRVHKTQLVPARQGFALADAVYNLHTSLGGGGIFLIQCMDYIAEKEREDIDRIIVITDEQDCDTGKDPSKAKLLGKYNYMINVASAKNGIGYKPWMHIDGWSEAVLDYIVEYEKNFKN
jgi:hypothetical protein